MKRRTYEYYVIAVDLGKDTEQFIHRNDNYEEAKKLHDLAAKNLKPGESCHLCTLRVIEKWDTE